MNETELAWHLERLIRQRQGVPTVDPAPAGPESGDFVVAGAPGPHTALYTAPHTAELPHPLTEPVFDDGLLIHNEEAGHVMATKDATAAYRAKRTTVQGLIAAVLVGVGGVLTTLQVGGEVDWKLLALSVGQAVLTAIISYLHPDKRADAQ